MLSNSRTAILAKRGQRVSRRGVAAVEFALVAPVFFLVVLGIIEFGRMAMVQQVLANIWMVPRSARPPSRYHPIPPTPPVMGSPSR